MDKKNPQMYLALTGTRLNTIVVDNLTLSGYRTNRNKDAEEPEYAETTEVLAGHVLRGNAGSTAYYLALNYGAPWNVMHGIDRARHSLNSFFKSYARGVCMRLAAAYNAHPHKHDLKFEGATRL